MKEQPYTSEELQTRIKLLTEVRKREFKSGTDLREVNVLLDPSLRKEFSLNTAKLFELINLQYVYGIIDLQLAIWRARLEQLQELEQKKAA